MENTILIVGVENDAAANHYIIDLNEPSSSIVVLTNGKFKSNKYGYDVEDCVDFRTIDGKIICVDKEISKKYVEDLGGCKILIHHVDGLNDIFILEKSDINEMLIKDYTFRRPSTINPIEQISYKSKFDCVW